MICLVATAAACSRSVIMTVMTACVHELVGIGVVGVGLVGDVENRYSL